MNSEVRDILAARRKLMILEYVAATGKVSEACHDFGIPRSSFYRWKKTLRVERKRGLIRKKPIARSHPRQIPPEFVDKILHLRTRYHIQVDVKFPALKTEDGRKIRRYQYTAIDDATRVRALKIYQRHNQKSSIDFIDYVVDKFPFRIHTVRTDRGHEWQAQFHWHVEDKGIRHVYIKPRSPQLNGKVERSHRSDQEEFYQLLTYTDDVDLNKKLATWEEFYNYNRPHGAHDGKTPYEALRIMLK
jgi:transposase InsO family protein